MEIDTNSYKWWRNGKEPNGVDYYSFEVRYDYGRRAQTYLFYGDYFEGLERVKEKFENITQVFVGI